MSLSDKIQKDIQTEKGVYSNFIWRKDVKQFIRETEVDIANPALTSSERIFKLRKRAGDALI